MAAACMLNSAWCPLTVLLLRRGLVVFALVFAVACRFTLACILDVLLPSSFGQLTALVCPACVLSQHCGICGLHAAGRCRYNTGDYIQL